MKHILILEDDLQMAKSLGRDFEDHGYTVTLASRLKEIPEVGFTHAVVDLRLAGGDFGLDAVTQIRSSSPNAKIVVLSGYGSVATAVEALKRGATDYLMKPASFNDIEKSLNGERTAPEAKFERRSLSEVEHEYIEFVLTKNEGNISKTAKDLGLHRQSLQRKLKKYT